MPHHYGKLTCHMEITQVLPACLTSEVSACSLDVKQQKQQSSKNRHSISD